MINTDIIENLLKNSADTMAEAVNSFSAINSLLYDDSKMLFLACVLVVLLVSAVIKLSTGGESSFGPKQVAGNVVLTLILLVPIKTSLFDLKSPSFVEADSASGQFLPLGPYLGWVAVYGLLKFMDEKHEKLPDTMESVSYGLLSQQYTDSLLSSYKQKDIARNVMLYQNSCNKFAVTKEFPAGVAMPTTENFKEVGLLGGVIGYDLESTNDILAYSQKVRSDLIWESPNDLTLPEKYFDSAVNFVIGEAEEATKVLSIYGAHLNNLSTDTFKFGTLNIPTLVVEDNIQETLIALSRVPSTDGDMVKTGLRIPKPTYLIELNTTGSDVSDADSFFVPEDMVTFASRDTDIFDQDIVKSMGDIRFSESLFYPQNCAEFYEVARMSVVSAMTANYLMGNTNNFEESTKVVLNKQVGQQLDVLAINALAMTAYYDQSKADEGSAAEVGTNILAGFSTVTSFFKGISTGVNAALVFSWSVLGLAFLLNIFPLIALLSILTSQQYSLYGVYFKIITMMVLNIVIMRLFNIVIDQQYASSVAKMQLEFISTGQVTSVSGASIMSLEYGGLLLVSLSTAASAALVFGKPQNMGGGNSHVGETAAVAATLAGKAALGPAGKAVGAVAGGLSKGVSAASKMASKGDAVGGIKPAAASNSKGVAIPSKGLSDAPFKDVGL